MLSLVSAVQPRKTKPTPPVMRIKFSHPRLRSLSRIGMGSIADVMHLSGGHWLTDPSLPKFLMFDKKSSERIRRESAVADSLQDCGDGTHTIGCASGFEWATKSRIAESFR